MSDNVGSRLRVIRKAKGLSQRELAKRAGVTNSTISLIEQDRVSPSVGSLKKVLDGIPMTMADFFTMGVNEDRSKTFFPKDSQPNMGQDNIEFYLIGVGRPDREIEVMREVYGVGADTGEEVIEHEGQEGGVIISGQLELTIGDSVQILNPGDGYYFDCLQPHRFRNIGDEELHIISANSPPNF